MEPIQGGMYVASTKEKEAFRRYTIGMRAVEQQLSNLNISGVSDKELGQILPSVLGF